MAVGSTAAAAPRPVPVAAREDRARPPPRIVLREAGLSRGTGARPSDADGWTKVESRRERRKRRLRPRQPVPADLRGKCFNCFSTEHRATCCRSQTRCFRCRKLGHRSAACPRTAGVAGPAIPAPRRLVWRPLVSPARNSVPPTTSAAHGVGAPGRKRRRRP
jgi:hypothetical protein